jgi:hypothetical protein
LAFSGASSVYADPRRPLELLRDHGLDLSEFSIITGHIPFATAHHCFAPAAFATVLRDPAWLLISNYCSQPSNRWLPDFGMGKFGRQLGWRWRFDRRFRERAEWAIDNIQVRMLCDDPEFGRPATPGMLASAKRNLMTRYTLVGFQDRLDKFILSLGELYGIDLVTASGVKLNQTGGYVRFVSDRHLAAARRHCRLDDELYCWAREYLDKRPTVRLADPRPAAPYRKLSIGLEGLQPAS